MAGKAPGSSEQSLTLLSRTVRLYEGESWWLLGRQGEVRGLLLLDGGADLVPLWKTLASEMENDGLFVLERQMAARVEAQTVSARVRHSDCQVTVEERTQLFSPFRGNG